MGGRTRTVSNPPRTLTDMRTRPSPHRQGPFDGLLGFSQGAALVGMLCHMRARGELPWLQIRFAVMIAGTSQAEASNARGGCVVVP